MANQVIVSSNNTVQVSVEPTPDVQVTISRTAVGTIANVPTANYANFAGNVVNAAQPNITTVGTLTNLNVANTITTNNLVVNGNFQVGNLVANTANYANFAGSANTANSATVANSANSVAGANVTGTVANATYAANAGFATTAGSANTANSATVAASANSVTLANVSGAGNIASINLDGSTSNVLYGNGVFAPAAGGNTANANYANFAGTAFSVSGSNVSGTVANATYAANAGNATIANSANSVTLANVSGAGNIASINLDGSSSNVLRGDGTFAPEGSTGNANYANFAGTAFAVSGSNVSGAVANATFADDAGNANIANIAYSVAAANVSGLGNIATINLDGNTSNLLDGTGNWVAIPTVSANANYANFAGDVVNSAQPNITSVGNLSALTVTGNITSNTLTWSNALVYNGSATTGDKILVQSDLPGGTGVRNLPIRAGNVTNASASNTVAGGMLVQGGAATSTDAGNAFIARGGIMVMFGGLANSANGAAQSGGCQLSVGTAISNNGNATSGALFLTGGSATANNGNAIVTNSILGAAVANATNGNALGNNLSLIGANARTVTTGNALGGNLIIISGNARSENGNATSGSINITTAAAVANVTAGTATVGNITIDTGSPNGITANVRGTINIGNSGFANAVNIGSIITPVNVIGNLTSNVVVANYLYGDGSNITGITATNANYANFAGNAFSVDAANVVGLGNIATINLDGNVSNLLAGDGTFVAIPTSTANANYANFAGTVLTNAQPNITSVGALTGLGTTGQISVTRAAPTVNESEILFTVYGDGGQGELLQLTRRRNGNTSARQGVVANDYIGNIEWQGASTTAGGGFQSGAKIAPRVDSAYAGPSTGPAVPIGIEMILPVGSGANLTHNFYSNGNVRFNNTVNANIMTANYLYGDGSNITGISGLSAAGSNTWVQYNSNGAFDASSAFRFDSGNLALDGNLFVSANNSSTPPVVVTNEGNSGISLYQMFTDTSVFPVQNFYRTRGNNATKTAVNSNDTIFTQNYSVYADSGNTFAIAGYQENKVGTNYGNGEVSLITSFVANTASGSSFNVSGYEQIGLGSNVQVVGRNLYLNGANTGPSDISSVNLVNGSLNWTLDNTNFGGGTPFGMNRYNTGFLEPLNYFTARGNAATPADVQIGDSAYAERVQVLYDGTTHGIFNGDVIVGTVSTGNPVPATYQIGSYDDQANSVFQVNFGTSSFDGNINIGLSNITLNSSGIIDVSDQVNIASGTITLDGGSGIITAPGSAIANTQLNQFQETTYAIGSVSGTITPDFNNGSIQSMTLTGNITLNSLDNAVAGRSMTLILTQDGTGGRTLTSSMLFAGASKTLSTAGSAIDIISVFYDGTTYYASLSKGYA